MEDKQCKIHVTNLKKNFGKLEVLKDISVDVQEGEVVVLLGPSGSGKSTLLRCLNQLETATSGKIIIDGHDVTDKHTDINKVRENIGMVFQHFNLFNHLTVLDNMILAPVHLKLMNKEEARTEALRLLERVGLADKADAFPSQLSGGQKQRVAIARALEMKPDIMLFHNSQYFTDHLRIQSTGWFIKEHDIRLHFQGTSDRYTLFLSTGQLAWECICLICQSDSFQKSHGLGLCLFLAHEF